MPSEPSQLPEPLYQEPSKLSVLVQVDARKKQRKNIELSLSLSVFGNVCQFIGFVLSLLNCRCQISSTTHYCQGAKGDFIIVHAILMTNGHRCQYTCVASIHLYIYSAYRHIACWQYLYIIYTQYTVSVLCVWNISTCIWRLCVIEDAEYGPHFHASQTHRHTN